MLYLYFILTSFYARNYFLTYADEVKSNKSFAGEPGSPLIFAETSRGNTSYSVEHVNATTIVKDTIDKASNSSNQEGPVNSIRVANFGEHKTSSEENNTIAKKAMEGNVGSITEDSKRIASTNGRQGIIFNFAKEPKLYENLETTIIKNLTEEANASNPKMHLETRTFAEKPKNNNANNIEETELIQCNNCGCNISDTSYLFENRSPVAFRSYYVKMAHRNVMVETVINPYGVHFDVITVEKAQCKDSGKSHGAEYSWYPGYGWKVCVCPHCGHHLGWTFFQNDNPTNVDKPKPKEFFVLVLSSLMEEYFVSNVEVIGKAVVILSLGCLFTYVILEHLYTFRKLCFGLFHNVHGVENIQDVHDNRRNLTTTQDFTQNINT